MTVATMVTVVTVASDDSDVSGDIITAVTV
jgi:hypothetical protein